MERVQSLFFPIKGLHKGGPLSAQPAGTSPALINVMSFDSSERARGGTRPGLTPVAEVVKDAGYSQITRMQQIVVQVGGITTDRMVILARNGWVLLDKSLEQVAQSNWNYPLRPGLAWGQNKAYVVYGAGTVT